MSSNHPFRAKRAFMVGVVAVLFAVRAARGADIWLNVLSASGTIFVLLFIWQWQDKRAGGDRE